MSRIWLLVAVFAMALSGLIACEKVEDNPTDPGGGGSGVPNFPDDIAIVRDVAPILADGVGTVDLFVTVVDSQARALADIGVSFTSSAGSIVPFATTDFQGVARTRLTSVASAADVVATVTASASSDTTAKPMPEDAFVLVTREPVDSELLELAFHHFRDRVPGITSGAQVIADQINVAFLGITMTLDANPATVPADGMSTSRIAVNLVETTSRVPLANKEVRFGASSGSVTGRVVTDATGTATALLTSTDAGATATVTAFTGNQLSVQGTVTFSALRLLVESGVSGIEDTGTRVTTVTATLLNAENNPVQGASVAFTTDQGVISSPGVTDAAGEAKATLRSPAGASEAAINATFGDLSVNHTVSIGVPNFTLTPASLAIPAGGESTTDIAARVITSEGEALSGVLVRFETSFGSITASDRTGVDGVAVASLESGLNPGEAVVTARYAGGGEAQAIVTFTAAPGPASMTLVAAEASVLADGLASTQITAVVLDANGEPVVPGTPVVFTATRGVLSDALPTDGTGTATAQLTATRFQTGTARVTARAGGIQQAVDVSFVSEDAAQIVVLDINNPRIGVRGSGQLETAVVTYEVRDANGIPVDDNHAATLDFRIVPLTGEIDATVTPASATTNRNGAALATVQAGMVSGAIELEARSGALVSAPIPISVQGDLPDPAHFSVHPEKLNIHGLVAVGLQNGITAQVGDAHGNPVPVGTAVWYEAEYGLVQGSEFTDDHGAATVWEITGAPFPAIPGGDGLVTITAQTVSKAGDRITTSTQVMWSGPTLLNITSPAAGFDIPNGGSVEIEFTVMDANGNPLVGGTSIEVTTTKGDLGGTTSFVLPDTQSSAFTMFSAVLADADPDETLTETVTVTIDVVSPNGNRQIFITRNHQLT